MIVLLQLLTTKLIAQNGSISGKVTDSRNNEPLIGAAVTISGTTTGSATDFDGKYTISNLKPGTYPLTISYISYKTQTKTDVVVETDKLTAVDIQMESADISLKEVQVVARANRESENILLMEQKKAVLATQAVGYKEMSRKGISDAESAVAKVSGISKQEGVKNVFVRGLGDRYNATALNGFPVPSEDPEYKNIALDFFGTDIIQNIGVNKVFNSSLAGDVGGAVIDISSKELVGQQAFNIELTGGANFSAVQNDFFIQSGSNYPGFADKSRPAGSDFLFKNSLDPHMALPLNHAFSISGGKSYKLGENANPLSFFVVASHGKSYSAVIDEIVRNTTPDGAIWLDQKGRRYSANTNQLALANVQYGFSPHRLNYNFMMLHVNSQWVGEYEGKNSERHQDDRVQDRYQGFLRRQQTNDNLLIVNQINSDWKLSDNTKLNVGVASNNVTGSEPDRRENYLTKSDTGESYFYTGSNRQKRFYSLLRENDLNLKVNLTCKITDSYANENSNLKVGYTGRYVNDRFDALEYNFSAVSGFYPVDGLKMDQAYNQTNYQNDGFTMTQGFNNNYKVTKFIHSPFAEITYQLSPKLIANAGLKVDVVDLNVNYDVEILPQGKIGISKLYLLPGFNLKYDVFKSNSLRLGLSKTYTLPQSKEISPYQYVSISFASQGNRNIKPSENYNADLKWDYYISSSELLTLTGFYKHILSPIGRVDGANSAGLLTYTNIADYATVAGIEIEIRKNIFDISGNDQNRVNRLSAGLNASYIYSDLRLQIVNTTPRNEQLEGAAPVILNFDLSHNFSAGEVDFVNSFVFNYFNGRIHTIGAQGFKNIMEEGVPTLDFVSSSKVNRNLTLKLKASNIMNPAFRLTRDTSVGSQKIVLSEFRKGTSLSIGLTYDL